MKLIVLLLSLTVMAGCVPESNTPAGPAGEDDETDDSPPSPRSIEDRWLLPGLNTMYEFDGSVRRTFYCAGDDGEECDDAYWASLTLADAIPGENPYTFDGETLNIDLHFGNLFEDTVVFECDEGRLTFEVFDSVWLRLGADLQDCSE